jgi:hypothetical protein
MVIIKAVESVDNEYTVFGITEDDIKKFISNHVGVFREYNNGANRFVFIYGENDTIVENNIKLFFNNKE